MAKFRPVGITDDYDVCSCCGKSGLKRVVMMLPLDVDGNPDGPAIPYGTTCAAREMGWSRPTSSATKRRVETEAFQAQRKAAQIRHQEIMASAVVGQVAFDLAGGITIATVPINGEPVEVRCTWDRNGIYSAATVKRLALDRYATARAGYPPAI